MRRVNTINQMNYPHALLCGTVISLLTASCAYAVESPVTPGPSVGHRPVINGLVLATSSGDITQSSTLLIVGATISRTLGTVADVDGDPVETGEYCVWYRVDSNTNVESVVKDPGAGNRNCEYTLQAADVGFKIKNVIKVFSDLAVASANGMKLNPDESWPVETVSANVVATLLPFPASTHLSTHRNPFDYSLTSGFPSAGFTRATFTINTGNNSLYDWSSNQPSWISVDTAGIVTFTAKPTAATKRFRILAVPKADKSLVYYHDFTVNTWWYNNGSTWLNWEWSKRTCETNGVFPYASDMLGRRGAIAQSPNSLYANWGDITKYAGSGFGAYSWTNDPEAFNQRTFAWLDKGGSELSHFVSNDHPVTCFQYL